MEPAAFPWERNKMTSPPPDTYHAGYQGEMFTFYWGITTEPVVALLNACHQGVSRDLDCTGRGGFWSAVHCEVALVFGLKFQGYFKQTSLDQTADLVTRTPGWGVLYIATWVGLRFWELVSGNIFAIDHVVTRYGYQ